MTIKVKIPERSPSVVRLRAQILAAPAHRVEPATANHNSAAAFSPTRRSLRNLAPLSVGQTLRAGLLILACFGLAQLPQVERASAEKANVATTVFRSK